MPTLANSSTELTTLNIHKFPSLDAYNAAVANSEIGLTDISFVEGDNIDVPLPTAQDVGYVLTAGASGSMYWAAGGGGGGGGGSTVTAPSSTVTVGTTSTWYVAIDGASKYIQLPSSIPSGWLGTSSTAAASGNHSHGTITYEGKITGQNSYGGTSTTNNQVAIASGDRLVIGDWSAHAGASYPLKLTTISFGTDTTKFLRNDGTWVAPSGGGGGGGAQYLNDLLDVNAPYASDGNVLMYSSATSSWEVGTISHPNFVPFAGAHKFSDTSSATESYVLGPSRRYDFYTLSQNTTFNVSDVDGIEAENYILVFASDGDKTVNFNVTGFTNVIHPSLPITVLSSRCMEFSIIKKVDSSNNKFCIITNSDNLIKS